MGQNCTNNTSQNISNFTSSIDLDARNVATWLIITVGLVLTPVAIYAVYCLVRKNNVAPVYVVNLLTSDLVQLCCMVINETGTMLDIVHYMFHFALMVSVGFMLCIALERYLAIVWPLWYRTRRTIKMSVVVCAVVWTLSLLFFLLHHFWIDFKCVSHTMFGVFLLLPFPLLVFFLVGTLRALSASISVHAEEKRRIVGLLVLVLLIYTLLFLPGIMFFLVGDASGHDFAYVSYVFFKLSPLADLFLYIFLRKGALNQMWFCLCCCRKNRTSRQSSSGLNDGDTVTSL